MSRVTLTSSAYAVLGLLARRPSSGYEWDPGGRVNR